MDLEKARFNMVEQQIRPWEVLDQRVLDTLAALPREHFVAEADQALAFADIQLPIGHGQAMMEPKLEARLLQALDVQPADVALEIGTGSGFFSALLGHLAAKVYSVDLHGDLSETAAARLAAHGLDNVSLEIGDAAQGWPGHAPYDVIAVTGSLPSLSETLKQQLKVGGRLIAVVGDSPVMEALLITRVSASGWSERSLFDTDLPRLEGIAEPKRFAL